MSTGAVPTRAIPDYPAGLVGAVFAALLACAIALLDHNRAVWVSRSWAAFYVPFVLVVAFFAVSEHELESNGYAAFALALTPRKQIAEYYVRALLAAFLGVVIGFPYDALGTTLTGGATGPRSGHLNELELRLVLLMAAHVGMLFWDTLVLFLQNRTLAPKPLIAFSLIAGDALGVAVTFFALWYVGPAADKLGREIGRLIVFSVAVMYAFVYFGAASRVLFMFEHVFSAGWREFFSIQWAPPKRSGTRGPELSLGATRAIALGALLLAAGITVASWYVAIEAFPGT